MKSKTYFAFSLLMVFSSSSFSGWLGGNDLAEKAKEWKIRFDGNASADTVQALGYQLYIFGILDTAGGILFCIPEAATGGQVFSVVYNYIDQHPEKWSDPAYHLVAIPLSTAFPCENK